MALLQRRLSILDLVHGPSRELALDELPASLHSAGMDLHGWSLVTAGMVTLAAACGGDEFVSEGAAGSTGLGGSGGNSAGAAGVGGAGGALTGGSAGQPVEAGIPDASGPDSSLPEVSVPDDAAIPEVSVPDGAVILDVSVPEGGEPVGLCPTTPPESNTPCPTIGVRCSYGDALRLDCRTMSRCEGGAWQTVDGNCPPIPGPAELGCPATDPAQTTCDATTAPPACSYSAGYAVLYVCGCVCLGSGCTWDCPEASNQCPAFIPNLGTACSQAGQTCEYGNCSIDFHYSVQCSNNRWVLANVPCPA